MGKASVRLPKSMRALVINETHLSLQWLEMGVGETRSFSHDGFLFLIPQGGEASCVCGSLRTPMSKGHFLVVANSGTNRVLVEEAREFRAGWFTVRLDHMFPLFGSTEIALLRRVSEAFLKPRRFPVHGGVAKECSDWLRARPSCWNLEQRSRLLCVVAEVLAQDFERIREEGCSRSTSEQSFLKTFESLTVDDLQDCSIDQLAAKFHCGRRHLNRQFQRYLGLSVAELRKEARLMKAYCLLHDPVTKIMSVAEQCGFHHLGLFNATFRARFGTSPGQVRKGLVTVDSVEEVLDRLWDRSSNREECRSTGADPRSAAAASPQAAPRSEGAESSGPTPASGDSRRIGGGAHPLKSVAEPTRDWMERWATALIRSKPSTKNREGSKR